MPSFKFGREEKLKSKKAIDLLFNKGTRLKKHPLLLIYQKNPITKDDLKMGVSVPKRSFKKAVDRNRLKRQIRESYRLNKNLVLDTIQNSALHYNILFIYTGRDFVDYQVIDTTMKYLINTLKKRIEKDVL